MARISTLRRGVGISVTDAASPSCVRPSPRVLVLVPSTLSPFRREPRQRRPPRRRTSRAAAAHPRGMPFPRRSARWSRLRGRRAGTQEALRAPEWMRAVPFWGSRATLRHARSAVVRRRRRTHGGAQGSRTTGYASKRPGSAGREDRVSERSPLRSAAAAGFATVLPRAWQRSGRR